MHQLLDILAKSYKKDYEKCLLTPVMERDGFTITCSKVSKTSESRLRRNR